jgi:hypothetical protein
MIPALLSGVVTTLIKNNLNGVAQAVMDKGLDYVEEKTGIQIKADMSPEEIAQLRESAAKHEEFKIEQANKDRADARNREIQIATNTEAPLINKIVVPALALGTVSASFILFAILIFVDVQDNAKDILIYILGALNSAVTMILAYYFGSSVGSHEKDNTINLLKKGN